MKKKALIFVCTALLMLMVVPVINLSLGNVKMKAGEKWWNRSVLYNIDFALPYLSRFFYPLGISTDPNQVIIGKEGWLYLGEYVGNYVTVRRRGTTAKNMETVREIGLATKSWSQWLNCKHVSLFKVMLAPDKKTIYPEFLPYWIRPAADASTNSLLAKRNQELYVDTSPALIAAKSKFPEPLYYKTDTHWNSLGAWVAFRVFTTEISRTEKGLHWLSDQQVRVLKPIESPGRDLANFLRMTNMLRDSDVPIEIDTDHPIEIKQYDFETGHLVASGGNPILAAPQHPLLVNSKHALNRKRVLWLRDSFGIVLAPFMAATFNEVLQLHYNNASPLLISRLVDTFKPDYVFITVVERDACNKWFANFPPLGGTSEQPKNFVSLSQGSQNGIYEMTQIKGEKTYKISGADPQIFFALSDPVRPQDASQLVFKLNCEGKKEPVNIQFFWHSAGGYFNEDDSLRFTTTPGFVSVDLSQFHSWSQGKAITDVRIDFDLPNTCPVLTIDSLALGRYNLRTLGDR